VSGWSAGDHLAGVYDALYLTLAEAAQGVEHDAAVVRLHEASRAFGTLALELREYGIEVAGDPVVAAVMRRAVSEDPTGDLALYALSSAVGPRLLVSLRDYLANEDDARRRNLLTHGSDLVVREVRAVGRVALGAATHDGLAWAGAARALQEDLDGAGMSESLGQHL
jgi:hypothetical protein